MQFAKEFVVDQFAIFYSILYHTDLPSTNTQPLVFKAERKKKYINPLPDMPILCFSNSVANQDMMSKLWTNVYSYLIE